MEIIQLMIQTVMLVNYMITVLSSPSFTSPPGGNTTVHLTEYPPLDLGDNGNKRSYAVAGYGTDVLTCRDCKYVRTSLNNVKIEDKYDKPVETCPTSTCNLAKGENVCVKVGYNIKNTYVERYKCGNTTILDAECNYMSCPMFQDVCLKVFYPNNTITDCLYESSLIRKKYSPCMPILKYYTYSSNCTVSPAEDSCFCAGMALQASLTLLFGVVFYIVS